MLLSGFEDPIVNNDGQPFDVFYLTPEGGAFRSATLGVDDVTLQTVSLWPNPTTDIVKVVNTKLDAKGVIYDINGRLILDNIMLNEATVINMSSFESGVYFLKLTDQNNNASTVRRIIKQ